jgi:Uma2 family endonuclease
MPGARVEILNGRLIHVAPADEPHATAHADLLSLLRLHVAPGYQVACDMLTRTSKDNDFAPDASVYPEHGDGPRQLDELAFEVTSEQRLSIPTEKARELARRGVRRVFAILVKQKRVLEWSREIDHWRTLSLAESIQDRCLIRPLSVRALLDAAAVEDEVARAMLAKSNPVIAEASARVEAAAEARGEATGEARALRKAIHALAEVLGLTVDAQRDAVLQSLEADALRAILDRLRTRRSFEG